MSTYFATILISVIIYVVVGTYIGAKVKGIDDYFVANRRGSLFFLVGTIVASCLSISTFTGQAGFIYDKNSAFVLVPGLLVCGYVHGALYFGRYIRRSRALTVADYFGKRFDSRSVQIVAALTFIVGVGFYLIAVSQAVALVISKPTPIYTAKL